jgi:hypothetical protein
MSHGRCPNSECFYSAPYEDTRPLYSDRIEYDTHQPDTHTPCIEVSKKYKTDLPSLGSAQEFGTNGEISPHALSPAVSSINTSPDASSRDFPTFHQLQEIYAHQIQCQTNISILDHQVKSLRQDILRLEQQRDMEQKQQIRTQESSSMWRMISIVLGIQLFIVLLLCVFLIFR